MTVLPELSKYENISSAKVMAYNSFSKIGQLCWKSLRVIALHATGKYSPASSCCNRAAPTLY